MAETTIEINLRVLFQGIGDPAPEPGSIVSVEAVDANGPITVVDGTDVIFHALDTRPVVGGDIVQVRVPPTDGTFCIRWRIRTPRGRELERFTLVPATDQVIAFGDLQQVDRKTFQPTEDVVAAWAGVARDATAALEAADGAREAADGAAAMVSGVLNVSRAYAGMILEVRGNSWTEFGGDYSPPYAELLPAALGFTGLRRRGRAGRAAQDNSAIMVADVGDPGFAFNTADTGALLINDTGNNLMYLDSPTARRAIEEALRVMLALGSAIERIEETGWNFRPNQFGEEWHPTSVQPYASGGTARIGVYGGLQVDIPVPAGTSYLLCHGTDGAPGRRGMTVRVSQNGVEIAVKSLDGVTIPTSWEAKTGVAPVAIRLPNLAAGTITVTTDRAGIEGDAYAIIDALLPQSPTPRPILLVKPVRVTAPSHDKPEMLAYARDKISELASEFGRHVLVIDPAPGWDPASMLGADGLHPEPAGAEHAKDAAVTDVRARVWETAMQFALR